MGARIRATGARRWASRRRATSGRPNASVLPEPVGARPQTSRPARTSGMTAAWIGNGSVIPAAAIALQMVGGRPRSANVSSRGRPVGARAGQGIEDVHGGIAFTSYFVFNSAIRQSTKPESARRTRDRPATLHAIGRSAGMLLAVADVTSLTWLMWQTCLARRVASGRGETGDERLGVRNQPALPVPPQRARTSSTRRELDLHAARSRDVHRVGRRAYRAGRAGSARRR